jgi:hypothetical protein
VAKETGADRRHGGVVRSVRPISDPILPEADNRQGYLRHHTDNLLHPYRYEATKETAEYAEGYGAPR